MNNINDGVKDTKDASFDSVEKATEAYLINRIGAERAKQRLSVETAGEPRVFGGGFNFFHPENWYSAHSLIRYGLIFSGMYWRARNNARRIQLVQNRVFMAQLPDEFIGLRILHLSDLHLDLDSGITAAILEKVRPLHYDLCVLTGDYRAKTFGNISSTMEALSELVSLLHAPIYGILGNHDSIRMVPGMEEMGIRMLLNESIPIIRNNSTIYLSGIDDAHYFRVEDFSTTTKTIPDNSVSILLSHTPEIYIQAANSGFDLMLCGHTHGGQICLPWRIPIILDARCPRYLGRGMWQYREMQGYTSVGAGCSIVPARINCPPEITMHTLDKNST